MKFLHTLCISLSFMVPATVFGAQSPRESSGIATFTLTKPTEMPAETLNPGKYSIQIVDHLSDRMIVRVVGLSNKVQFVLLAVPAAAGIQKPSKGIIPWASPSTSTPAMRGFVFPSGYQVEFVYPKAQAAALAKVNEGRVIAVDPDSEGRPAVAQMSTEDVSVVHLWMLSLATVGSGKSENKASGIQAQAYQPPARTTSMEDASVQVSQATSSARQTPRVGQKSRAAAITSLPHTASHLPLILLVGLISLFAAFATYRIPVSSSPRISEQ